MNGKEFDQNYYEYGQAQGISCYTNYRWLPELIIPSCLSLIKNLPIDKDQTILDFGCAKGFFVKGFRLCDRLAYGVDISEYAIECAEIEAKPFLTCTSEIPLVNDRPYDWIMAKDVLEHIPYEELPDILEKLGKSGQQIFVVVPLGQNNKYEVPRYELDKTHRIRENLDWWINILERHRFDVIKALYNFPDLKQNYQGEWPKGNGFITGRKHGCCIYNSS